MSLKKLLSNDIMVSHFDFSIIIQQIQFKILPAYPRFSIDMERKIFTAGGISSSLDFTLQLF